MLYPECIGMESDYESSLSNALQAHARNLYLADIGTKLVRGVKLHCTLYNINGGDKVTLHDWQLGEFHEISRHQQLVRPYWSLISIP